MSNPLDDYVWKDNKLAEAIQRDLPLLTGGHAPNLTGGYTPGPPPPVPAGTGTPRPATCDHGYTVCRPCKFPPAPVAPPDLGMRGAWATDKPCGCKTPGCTGCGEFP